MLKTINFKMMRKNLIKIYEEFLKNPGDYTTYRKVVGYELKYGGLSSYNDILSSQPVPKDIEIALNGLSTIYQYNLWKNTHEAFSNDKIISESKTILENLKKEE